MTIIKQYMIFLRKKAQTVLKMILDDSYGS